MHSTVTKPRTDTDGELEEFDNDNLPPSTAVALDAIFYLVDNIEQVKTSIEFKQLAHFPSTEAFRSWQMRAITALSHMRGELAFLERWLQEQRRREMSAVSQNENAQTKSETSRLVAQPTKTQWQTGCQKICARWS